MIAPGIVQRRGCTPVMALDIIDGDLVLRKDTLSPTRDVNPFTFVICDSIVLKLSQERS